MSISRPEDTPIEWHGTAVVEVGATVGVGTRIWHHAHVRSAATIGDGCVVGKGVYIDRDVVIGNRVKLQNNVSVYAGVRIGDDVFVGPGAVFTNDRYPRATSAEWDIVPTEVERGASIGANATVICGVTIGQAALVGAGAVVTRSVRPHELVVGNPARHHGWVCDCGHRLQSPDESEGPLRCPSCGERVEI